jgi:hypothetical protein
MRAWLSLGYRRWSRRKMPLDTRENRHRLVRELAPGRSFIDVGGMWGIDGEIAFLAEEAGATRVTLLDGMDPTERFETEHDRRDSSVRYVQGDLHDPTVVEEVGSFDVVWCTGVIYHSPNPYLQIEHLRSMTLQRLLLGSITIPEIPGFPQAAMFYPGIPESAQKTFAAVHGAKAPGYLGVAAPFDRTPDMGYANCWWGLTRSSIRGMLSAARFHLMEELPVQPFATDFLAEPVPGESVIPPPDFARRRGVERLAAIGGDRPGWA